MAKHYLFKIGFIIVIGLLSISGINWFINPYSIYSSPSIERINKDKYDFISHLRVTKIYQVARQKPSAIILGSSRSGRGLDPEHPGWGNGTVYNLSVPGSSMFEMLRFFQHANGIHPLQKVVIGLDFRCFTSRPIDNEFLDARLRINKDGTNNNKRLVGLFSDIVATLFSTDALIASLRNLRRQGWNKEILYENGRWDVAPERQWDYRKGFDAYLKQRLESIGNELTTIGYTPTELELHAYRTFLRIAYKEGIEVYLAISPSHALHWEIYRALGLWDNFEEWKRSLIKINEDEAKHAGKSPYSLWDFSGYNHISIEKVPATYNAKEKMQWFWESVHYKVELGNLILNRLFDIPQEHVITEDFGFKLTSKNIEDYFQSQRASQKTFIATHSVDVKNIEKLAAKFLKTQKQNQSNENLNGLVHIRLPDNADLSGHTQQQLGAIVDEINSRL